MDVGSARDSSVAGNSDLVSAIDLVADFGDYAVLTEVPIGAERSISMINDEVIADTIFAEVRALVTVLRFRLNDHVNLATAGRANVLTTLTLAVVV